MSQMNQELFAELSSEQAAAIEGGLNLRIHKIQCLKAGADGFFGGGDDLKVRADGVLLNSPPMSMKSGRIRETNMGFSKFGDSIIVDLFDDDFPSSGDDHMGSFTARSTGGQIFTKRVSGSGSKYRIFYSAV